MSCLCIGCSSVTYLLCLYGEDMLKFIGRPIPCSHGRFHINLACLVHHLTVLVELLQATFRLKIDLTAKNTVKSANNIWHTRKMCGFFQMYLKPGIHFHIFGCDSIKLNWPIEVLLNSVLLLLVM